MAWTRAQSSSVVGTGTQGVEVSAAGHKLLTAPSHPNPELEQEIARVQAIAERDWSNLVVLDDYFEPQQEWVETTLGEYVQRADWIVAMNPELLPIGNYVVRCLLKRIKMRHDLLGVVHAKCQAALMNLPGRYVKQRAAAVASWNELDHSVAEIRRTFRTGPETRKCDACVVATQVYAAFHPAPDLAWLGLDNAVVEDGRAMLRARVTGWRGPEMLDRIATALAELQRLVRDMGTERPAIEAAVASGGLVVVDSSREVYWEQARIEQTLTKKQWNFLVALVSNARHGAFIAERDVFDDQVVSSAAMANAFGRLKDHLPASLWTLVVPGPERATYRLELEPSRIHFFE